MAIEDDVTNISAADIQRLARQYLVPGRKWSLAVLPKGMTLAQAAALDGGAIGGGK
jgi:zinc protease